MEKKKVSKEEIMILKKIITVELTDNNKVKRVYIKSIDDYSAKSVTPIKLCW